MIEFGNETVASETSETVCGDLVDSGLGLDDAGVLEAAEEVVAFGDGFFDGCEGDTAVGFLAEGFAGVEGADGGREDELVFLLAGVDDYRVNGSV